MSNPPTTRDSSTQTKPLRARKSCISNPARGLSLQLAAKAITVIQMVLAGVVMLLAIKYLLVNDRRDHDPSTIIIYEEVYPGGGGKSNTIPEKTAMVWFILALLWLYIHATFYKGIVSKNYKIVDDCWRIIVLIALLVLIVTSIRAYNFGILSELQDWTNVVFTGLNLCIIWIGYCYKQKLRKKRVTIVGKQD